MIRIAIPIFQNRVSPILDTCTRLLIIDYEKSFEIGRQEVFCNNYSLPERFSLIQKIHPNVIICCGISDVFDRMLQTADIRLVCGIAGEVDKVAEAFSVIGSMNPAFACQDIETTDDCITNKDCAIVKQGSRNR